MKEKQIVQRGMRGEAQEKVTSPQPGAAPHTSKHLDINFYGLPVCEKLKQHLCVISNSNPSLGQVVRKKDLLHQRFLKCMSILMLKENAYKNKNSLYQLKANVRQKLPP